MIKVISCGKAIATYTHFEDAFRHARNLSLQNANVPVYVQDGVSRSTLRNGIAF